MNAILVHTGAKLLRRNSKTGGISDAPTNVEQTSLEAFAKPSSQDVSATVFACGGEHTCKAVLECKHQLDEPVDQVVFGIPWEPVQFVQKVASAGHPRNIVSGLSEVLIQAAEEAASFSSNDLILRRCSWLGKYVAIGRQLQHEEAAIANAMPREMREVMKCKRLALMLRMLQDENYPDLAIVDDMCRGFDLVGDAPAFSGILPGKFSPSPAAIHVEVLCSEAARSRQAVLATTRSSGDGAMDLKLWQKTLEERDKGCALEHLEENAVTDQVTITARALLTVLGHS